MSRSLRTRSAAVLFAAAVAAAGCSSSSNSNATTNGSGGSTNGTSGSGSGGGNTSDGPFIDAALDCESGYNSTEGVSGDTIKIGTIRPQTGSFAIYDQVTVGMEAYFKAMNEAGGIKAGDGKSYKIELIKKDDAYDPAKTPALAKELVESDKVFALVGVIGTENNKAIRDYLNKACIPDLSLATGSPEWGQADKYPWYISALPSYATEAHGWVEYLKANKPEAKVAMVYQDDDFGQAYNKAFKKAIAGSKITVVGEETFNPLSGGTTEASVTKLSQSGADTFIVGIGGSPCPTTLKFVPTTWKPTTIISVTCAGSTALSLAGGADEGVIAIQPNYDPSDPADADQPSVKEFMEKGQKGGLTEAQIKGGISSAGWGFAALFAKALELSPKVDRADVTNTIFSLKDKPFGLVREGVTVNTNNAADPWAVEGFRVVQRKAPGWVELVPVKNYEGQSNSFAG